MAKSSNLREFQESILAKLKIATSQDAQVSTSRLGVMVGDKRMLIDLSEVSEVLPVPALQLVPHTRAWFLGVANVRGNLFNVTDLAQFMGLASSKSNNNRILLLNSTKISQAAIVVGSLVGLRSIETMQSLPNDSAHVFARHSYTDADQQTWVELDIEALIQDDAFVQPNL